MVLTDSDGKQTTIIEPVVDGSIVADADEKSPEQLLEYIANIKSSEDMFFRVYRSVALGDYIFTAAIETMDGENCLLIQ